MGRDDRRRVVASAAMPRPRVIAPRSNGASRRLLGLYSSSAPARASARSHLELERRLRELGVDRLRAQRVGLAMQLLGEEIEPLAGAAAVREHARTSATCVVRRASSSATSTLVANSASSCFRRSSLGSRLRLAQPRAELFDVGRVDRRNARRDARDLRFDVGAAREQDSRVCAFALARGCEVRERVVDEPRRAATSASPARRCEHPRPAQDLGDRQRRRLRDEVPHRARRRDLRATRSGSTAHAARTPGGCG